MSKLMVSIGQENFQVLSMEAKVRGITIQELLRAVIVPDWIRTSQVLRIERSPIQVATSIRPRENDRRSSFNGR